MNRKYLGLLLPLLLLASCLYANLPDDPSMPPKRSWLSPSPASGWYSDPQDQPQISTNYNLARVYARDSYAAYDSFLQDDEYTTYGLGGLLFAAGGASVGLAAAVTSTDASLAIAEMGIGGGTGTAYWLWSRNKPKMSAYNVGRSAVDCVISQADQFAPNVARYDDVKKDRGALQAAVGTLRTAMPEIGNSLSDLQSAKSDPNFSQFSDLIDTATKQASQISTDANSALNDASAQLTAADNVLTITQRVPSTIVDQVRHVDVEIKQSAFTGIPDIATISQTKLPTLPFSSASPKASPIPPGGAHPPGAP
ncbi:MAG: hypothetical protein WAL68_02715, partial [Candidatus Binatus sp.]